MNQTTCARAAFRFAAPYIFTGFLPVVARGGLSF